MKALTFRTDLLSESIESIMSNRFNKFFIECKKEEATYKVVDKWRNHENKMRQRSIYLKIDAEAEDIKQTEYLEIHNIYEV